MTTLAVPGQWASALEKRLLASTPLEDGGFFLLHRAGDGEKRLVLGDAVAPVADAWVEQAAERLTPNGQWISAATSAANSADSGLAFVHTHPCDHGRPQLSAIDRETSQRLGSAFADLLDGPFASVVISPGGWTAVVFTGGQLEPVRNVALVGRHLRVYGGQGPVHPDLDDRQVRAFGRDVQSTLAGLRVGIVGAGGLGSPAAETLVRMGTGSIVLVDDDVLDTPSNARRVFGVASTSIDVHSPQPKSLAVAAGLGRLGLGSRVSGIVGDIRRPAVQAQLLDVDVLICATDTHSSRAALSEFALRSAIPLIDVGVRVGARTDGSLDALRLERRVQLPEGPCLMCWGALDPERIRAELLPEHERAALIEEGYVTGDVGAPAPSVAALTVTAAGAATAALLALLAGAFDVAPLAASLDVVSLDSFALPRDAPDPVCICARWRPAYTLSAGDRGSADQWRTANTGAIRTNTSPRSQK